MTTLTLELLCAAANRRLVELDQEPADGRTNPQVTPRNVRFYQSLGLLSPVGRDEGRARYTDTHLDEIVAIKTAQASGRTLREIAADRAGDRLRPVDAGTNVGQELAGVALQAHALRLSRESPVDRWGPTQLIETHRLQDQVRRALAETSAEPADLTPQVVAGWFVDLPGGMRLSGTGQAPDRALIERVVVALEPTDLASPDNRG